jgi:hypothetical protein
MPRWGLAGGPAAAVRGRCDGAKDRAGLHDRPHALGEAGLLAVLEVAARTKIMLDTVDGWLLRQPSPLVVKRGGW